MYGKPSFQVVDPSPQAPGLSPCRHHRPVILVVDDDLGVHEACHALLADQYDLLKTHDGLTALTTLASHRVDLVVLDLRLPGLDGLKVLSQIAAARPQLRVIVLTAIMSVRTAVEAMKLGAFDYLTKPFSGEDLCLLIKAALASDRDDAGVLRECHHHARHPQDSAASILFVGNELGPLVTMKLVLERFVVADVAVNTTIALRWLTQHLPTLLMVHDSLLPADGARLVRLVQSIAPACPMLLVAGSAPDAKLTPELASLPRYALTGDPSVFDSLLRELINVLSIRHRMVGPAPAFSPYVLKALAYLSTHYAEALQVKMVAEAIGISPGHLAHLFPAEIQVTVKEFVAKIRIEVAKQLLYDRGYTLEYVAEKVGFSDASHLSRVFQRFTGDRPGTYRRRIVST